MCAKRALTLLLHLHSFEVLQQAGKGLLIHACVFQRRKLPIFRVCRMSAGKPIVSWWLRWSLHFPFEEFLRSRCNRRNHFCFKGGD
jgi:hypothetical protein